MSPESSTILHGEQDQDVLTAMYNSNRLPGGFVRPNFIVLRLLCCVSGNFCYLMKHCDFVHRDDDIINDEVATVREEVERYHISRSRAIRRSQSPGFPDYGRFLTANIPEAGLDDAHEARMEQVPHAAVREADDVPLRGFLTTGLDDTLRAVLHCRESMAA